MLYVLFAFLLIIAIWGLLVYIRKTMWDAVHRNLLDLEDTYGGKVIRRSFAARPYYHGKIKGIETTLNFSTQKISDRRVTYIDISYFNPSSFSFTLSSLEWLNEQDAGELNDYMTIKNDQGKEFIIRPVSDDNVHAMVNNDQIRQIINTFNNLAYIFVGRSGIICEYMTEEVVKSTEIDTLKPRLQLLQQLGESVRR